MGDSLMSLLAIAHIDHPNLGLCPTIWEYPDTTIRVMPHAATDPETGLFFFFMENGGKPLESAFERDQTVAEWTKVAESESGSVYRLHHTPETILLSPKTTELGGLMREATNDMKGWTVRLQFSDQKDLSRLWDYCSTETLRSPATDVSPPVVGQPERSGTHGPTVQRAGDGL
jgi:hypothetical protein